MSRKLDIKKGDTVFARIEEGSNASRRITMTLDNVDKWVLEGIVISVGRRYITVKFSEYHEEKFDIEHEYRQKHTCGGADYKLYTSKQEILDEREATMIYRRLRNEFTSINNKTFTLDQLRRIRDIVSE